MPLAKLFESAIPRFNRKCQLIKRLGLRAASQESRAKRIIRPEVGLWSAVLKRAMQDALLCSKKEKREALKWINSNTLETGSICWVCEYLDICFLSEIRRIANTGDKEDYFRLQRVLFR